MISTRTTRDEEGAASSALLVSALLIALAAFMMIAVPFGDATDAKAGSRTAADAAALAGVEQVREEIIGELADEGWRPGWNLSWWYAGWGSAEASTYASLNDGALVMYHFDLPARQVHVTVEGRDVGGEQARSEAVAQIELPSCDPLPELPEQDDEDLVDPPEYDEEEIWCDGFWLPLQPVLENGQIKWMIPPGNAWGLLKNAMKTRLVG